MAVNLNLGEEINDHSVLLKIFPSNFCQRCLSFVCLLLALTEVSHHHFVKLSEVVAVTVSGGATEERKESGSAKPRKLENHDEFTFVGKAGCLPCWRIPFLQGLHTLQS